MTPRISVVIPARNEPAGNMARLLRGITACVPEQREVIVVVDGDADATPVPPPARRLVSTYGPGPANAIRFGIDHAEAPVIAVMMADGSDNPAVLPDLLARVEKGSVIACASRYMPGGAQIGGHWLKRQLSRTAGVSLWLAGAGTHDATNAYKAYDATFLKDAVIESRHGFEMGIEMVAKARKMGLPVSEVPVTWQDRTAGESHFRLRQWLPYYLKWWLKALRPS